VSPAEANTALFIVALGFIGLLWFCFWPKKGKGAEELLHEALDGAERDIEARAKQDREEALARLRKTLERRLGRQGRPKYLN